MASHGFGCMLALETNALNSRKWPIGEREQSFRLCHQWWMWLHAAGPEKVSELWSCRIDEGAGSRSCFPVLGTVGRMWRINLRLVSSNQTRETPAPTILGFRRVVTWVARSRSHGASARRRWEPNSSLHPLLPDALTVQWMCWLFVHPRLTADTLASTLCSLWIRNGTEFHSIQSHKPKWSDLQSSKDDDNYSNPTLVSCS